MKAFGQLNGQVADIIRLAAGAGTAKIKSILHYTGHAIDARFITDHLVALAQLERID